MTRWQKIKSILIGLFMLAIAASLLTYREDAYGVIMVIFVMILIFSGLRMLVYYFAMAKNMTGGKMILYMGILLTDLGLFANSLVSVPNTYILLYLVAMLFLSGIIDILNALESKKIEGHWKLRMLRGVGSIAAAAGCLFFRNSPSTVVIIYCLGLIYNGVIHIINGFRTNDIIAIQ